MSPPLSSAGSTQPWRFVKFGLLVTGQGEEKFLQHLFRPLMASGNCRFHVVRRVPQLTPITSRRPERQAKIKMVGQGKGVAGRDEEIALTARGALHGAGYDYVLLIDDLEHDRVHQGPGSSVARTRDIYGRYRQAMDEVLTQEKHRVAVHFLVYMMEAYYFADAKAINSVLGTSLLDHVGDVETIRHPKSDLKNLAPAGFDEKSDGENIMSALDVEHVLSRPDTCASLRTLFAWCSAALGVAVSERFRLIDGIYFTVTGAQIAALAGDGQAT